MNTLQAIFNSPVHWLIAMIVGDLTMLCIAFMYTYQIYRFLRGLIRGAA